MTDRNHARLAVIALGLWLSVVTAAFPVSAQPSPLAESGEPTAAPASPELDEIRRKAEEVRSRLDEWKARAAEHLAAGQFKATIGLSRLPGRSLAGRFGRGIDKQPGGRFLVHYPQRTLFDIGI